MALHVELIETESGFFSVIVGDRFADMLARDEALGVIAAALFGGRGQLPYLKDYVTWDWWDRKYRSATRREPVALLSWNDSFALQAAHLQSDKAFGGSSRAG